MPGLDQVLAVHAYDAVVQRFVLAGKNGGRRDLLHLLGRQLGRLLSESDRQAKPTVTWVPASYAGRRSRGYDPARILARVLAHEHGLPIKPLLSRHGRSSQAGLPRSQRLAGPDLRCRLQRVPLAVVVVDDVITTGASMSTTADVLREAGCSRVSGLCVASAGKRRDVSS